MKLTNDQFLTSFFILLIISYVTSARLLPTSYRDIKKAEVNGITHSISTQEDFNNLMGLEKCEDRDEACLNRRIVAEAHLDYIYTQNKPKP
ncbi:putative phytosulfokines 6 [Nicotiana tabacum]|uniref:Phytosulfokine n=1 Tax=Nicotiana tabacum TaxID=4097 RepID=A0A1S3Z0L7_TOBAC|nr:putative phytosulfokines 6 [Nicotiana tomentosiformis]XP_016457943.1 PREDICTED: putative phytosulfokines 6 [Nicotiana tabacum]